MKKCSKCQQELPYSEYHLRKKSKDGLQNSCKQCNRLTNIDYYRCKNKKLERINRSEKRLRLITEFVNHIKQKYKCYFCQESEICCLDFHHINNKEENISTLRRQKSLKKLKQEITKCIVVCSNCHRKIHNDIILIPDTVECCQV